MKPFTGITCLCLLLALGATGCGRKERVDTTRLQRCFKTADPATQPIVDKVVAAIDAGDYRTAFASLQKLAGQATVTPEQQHAIHDLMEQLQTIITAAAQKTAADLKKSPPGK
jgi:hypothetical protein